MLGVTRRHEIKDIRTQNTKEKWMSSVNRLKAKVNGQDI